MNGGLDNGIVYRGSLPVQFEALAALPEEQELLFANAGNELLLRTVTVLEEKPELDETDPLCVELRRQDLKLSLLLDMVGNLLQQRILPQTKLLEFTDTGITAGYDSVPLAAGQHCRIALYIEPSVPRALVLFGRMREDGSALDFVGIGQHVRDQLHKYIFRHHRRLVAMNRKS